ncbi:hypothetical protein AXF42_Ash008889 [Apostasia shenzhenica]|uniref:Uncharacterized protein n=1 Tax=Apostasia shenzhenica TaxID=1088818 RepID=A0A2I0ASS8_9ASPA|nr:hypothetical protein AXF42_Ash008889 [Apostasia shenzhenica]
MSTTFSSRIHILLLFCATATATGKYESWESLLDGNVPDGYSIGSDACRRALFAFNYHYGTTLEFEAPLVVKKRTVEGITQFYLKFRAADSVKGRIVIVKFCIAMSNPPYIIFALPLQNI